jgi:hypothetical protein
MKRDLKRIEAIFADIDRVGGRDFLPEGRPEQPPMARRKLHRLRRALVAGERSPLVQDYDIERLISELDEETSRRR